MKDYPLPPEFVVTKSGVIHVPYCEAAQAAKSVEPWDKGIQPGFRRCMRCYPALPPQAGIW